VVNAPHIYTQQDVVAVFSYCLFNVFYYSSCFPSFLMSHCCLIFSALCCVEKDYVMSMHNVTKMIRISITYRHCYQTSASCMRTTRCTGNLHRLMTAYEFTGTCVNCLYTYHAASCLTTCSVLTVCCASCVGLPIITSYDFTINFTVTD
jgi:hypothetical protein